MTDKKESYEKHEYPQTEYHGWNPVKRLSHCYCHHLTEKTKKNSWFENLLIKLIPHFDIFKVVDNSVVIYLRRFYIWRTKWISKWSAKYFGDVYLHHIWRSDDDPDPHDHPWTFYGFLLRGTYVDEIYYWYDSLADQPGFRLGPYRFQMLPSDIYKRYSEHIHQVKLPEGKTAWTIIFTGPYKRDWSFFTKEGPVMWREYLKIPDGIDVGE